MQSIKTFRLFESAQGLNENQIRFLDEFVTGTWKYDESSGLVDIQGNIDFSDRGFFDFQGIRFGRVSGDFDCSRNELVSLDGAPQKVGRNFYCSRNGLEDLVGAPNYVGGGFDAHRNLLMSLEGAPEEVGDYFEVDRNNLKDLEGSPEIVGGDFNCSRNPLRSMRGAPKEIGGEFESSYFTIDAGKWNILGFLEALDTSSVQAEELILGLITPKAINQSLQESPSETIKALTPFWNWNKFAGIWNRIEFPKEMGDIPTLMAKMQRVKDIEDLI